MPEIDSLSIKISAEASAANKAIGTLAQNLSALSNRLGKINGSSLSNFSSAMRTLSGEMENLQGVKVKDFTPIANGIKKFENINAGKISSVGGSLKTLAGGLNTISGISFNAESLNGISSALGKFGYAKATAGADNLLKIKNDLSQFVTGMNEAGSVTFDTTNLNNLITSISKLGSKSVKNAADNLPKLTTELNTLMETLSRAPKVSSNVIQMTNALANLARTGASSGRAVTTLSSALNIYSNSALKAGASTKTFRISLAGIAARVAAVIATVKGLSGAINIASDLTEVQNVVDVTFGDMAYKVEDFAKTSIKQFGLSELSLKQYASRFQAMGSAMGINSKLIGNSNKFLNEQTGGYIGLGDSMSDVSLNLTKLTADMASFYNVEQAVVAEDLAAIFTGMTIPLRKYGLDLTQATLQEWAMKNGLDANIQSMSQAEKTMLRYQYVLANSGAVFKDFERTQNSWSNQTRILRQNLEQLASVIGGTLVNAFKPLIQAMNAAMASIISFAETISNALGKIFGWKFEKGSSGAGLSGLASDASDLEDGLGGATKAAEKLRTVVLGIDELNINAPDDSSGTGGGGGIGAGAGLLGSNGGKWLKTDSLLEGYKSDIDSLFELGKYIGDTLSRAMESINWDSIYLKARNFGRGLAEFLNGLISPRLFGNVGKTIAGSLNTALNVLDSYGMTFDWNNFGLSIAAGINRFFDTFDFALLAHTLNVWAKGILNTAIIALDNTDWWMIGEKIGTFLAGIDILEIAAKLGRALRKTVSAAFEIFMGSLKSAPIETLLSSIIVIPNLFKAIISSKIITGIKNLAGQFVTFARGARLTATALAGNQGALRTLTIQYPKFGRAIDVAMQAFAEFRSGLNSKGLFTGLTEGFATISNSLSLMQKGVIGAVAGFAEFDIVSESMRDLTLGTENLAVGIAKIGGAVAVAGASLSTVFGFPGGVIAAGILGVGAALSSFNKTVSEQKQIELYGEKLDDFKQRMDASSQSIRNRIEASKEYIEGTGIAETNLAQGLADRYFDLSEKENLSNIEKAEMQALARKLVDTLPELEKYYDTETGLLDTTRQSIEKVIQSKLQQIQLNALEGQLTELYQAQAEALRNVTVARDKHSVSQERQAEIQERISKLENNEKTGLVDLMNHYEALGRQIVSCGDATGELSREQEELQERIMQEYGGKTFPTLEELNAELAQNKLELADLQGEYNKTAQALEKAETDYADATSTIGEYMQLYISGMAGIPLEVQNVLQNIHNGIEVSGEQIKEAFETAGMEAPQEFINAILEQEPVVQENVLAMFAQIQSGAEVHSTDLKLLFSQLGYQLPDELIAALSSKGGDVLENVTNLLSQMSSGVELSQEQITGLFSSVGLEASEALIQALSGQDAETQAQAIQLISQLAVASDSEKKQIMDNWGALGIDSGNKLITDFDSALKKKVEEMEPGITETSESIGIDWVKGAQKGIDETDIDMSHMVDGIIDGTKKPTEINSPSELSKRYGAWWIEGFNLGIQENTASTIRALMDWSETLKATLSSLLNEITWSETFSGMLTGFQMKFTELTTWWSEEAMPTWFEEGITPWLGLEKWKGIGANIKNGLMGQWTEFTELWNESLEKWWNTSVEPPFRPSVWRTFGSNMKNGIYAGFKGIVTQAASIMNGVIDVFNAGLANIQKSINHMIESFNEIAGQLGVETLPEVTRKNIAHVKIPKFAAGCVVYKPTLGMFGEAGREAVIPLTNKDAMRTLVNEIIEAGYQGYSSLDIPDIVAAREDRNNEIALIQEQNALLAEQNALIAEQNRLLSNGEVKAIFDTREALSSLRAQAGRNGFPFTK